MATLYFNGAVDSDWATLGNWWEDDAFTVPATSLPTSGDSVIASADIWGNSSGSAPTLVDFTMNAGVLGIPITVTGNAIFNGNAIVNFCTITGNATFNDYSYNYSGTVSGDATCNDYSLNDCYVSGDATFNDYSCNGGWFGNGRVFGHATFNDSSINNPYGYGGRCDTATFNGGSYNKGTVYGLAVFNDYSYSDFIQAGPYRADLQGDAVFNGFAYNTGPIAGNATFNDDSYHQGASVVVSVNWWPQWGVVTGNISGTATFRDRAANKSAVIGTLVLAYEKGINGSSILGVV